MSFPTSSPTAYCWCPRDLKPGERRPVVVCQHGLEGRPTDVFLGDNPAYHDFAARLAERGFVTFAPAEPVPLRRPLPHACSARPTRSRRRSSRSSCRSTSRSSIGWRTLPFVDRQRIAFYGLSYGGKTAMRVPPLVTDYCLSICSADFNEWVWKNASIAGPVQLRPDGRVRDLRVRPGQHVQLCRDGRPDRPAAVHGRAGTFRRRGPRRDRGLRVRQGAVPLRGASLTSATAAGSSGSSARTRSTARARLTSSPNNSPGQLAVN